MKATLIGAAAVLALLFAIARALAQTPTIAGDYVSTTRVFCQPEVSVSHSSGLVTAVGLGAKALSSTSIALEYFDPRTAIYTAIGFSEKGTPVLLNDEVNGPSGTPFMESDDSLIYFYSNDATTVTLNGITYHATWGHLKNTRLFQAVPEYFSLVAIDSNGCVRQSDHVRR